MLKNITLSADDNLIQKARIKALNENKSLNAVFREWIARYVGQDRTKEDFLALMDRLSYANPGRKFTRDEMNER